MNTTTPAGSIPEARSARGTRTRVQQRTLRGWCEEYERMETRERELENKIAQLEQQQHEERKQKDQQIRDMQGSYAM